MKEEYAVAKTAQSPVTRKSAKPSDARKARKSPLASKTSKPTGARSAKSASVARTAKGFPLPDWLRDARPGGIRGRKPVRGMTRTEGAYKAGAGGVHVFRLLDLEPMDAGRSAKAGDVYSYADTRAVVIEGKQMQVGLAYEKAGMGSRPHHHPNDQFNLVLKGTLRCKVGDEPEMLVPTGSVVYFPANVVHSSGATADEDVIFYVCKDLAWELVGIPVDKKTSGPKTGFAAVGKRAKA